MTKAKTHFTHRVLAFLLTLCLLLQVCPPAAVLAASPDDAITGGADTEKYSGDSGLLDGQQNQILNAGENLPQSAADTVYYVSLEDYTGSTFTSRVVKLVNPMSPRVVMLIAEAVGGWDGQTFTEDLFYDFGGQPYPNIILNEKVDPSDEWSDSYLVGLEMDGKVVGNGGSNKWIVTAANEYGAAEYCKYSRANADYNTLASGSVVRVMYTTRNGGCIGAGNVANGGELNPNKDALVVAMAEAGEGHPAYAEAMEVLVNGTNGSSAVQAAIDKLAAAPETNPDAEAAAPVISMIEALPAAEAVTEENRAAVEEARAAYDLLTPAQQALVTNYDKLTAAEAALNALTPKSFYYVSLEDHTGTFASRVMKVESSSKNPTMVIMDAVDGVGIWHDEGKSYPITLTIDGTVVANTNGPVQEGNYWIVSLEGRNKYDDVNKSGYMAHYYERLVKGGEDNLADNAVIRLIYTNNADGAVTPRTDIFTNDWKRDALVPDKTQLVKDLAEKVGDPAYDDAMAVLLNPKATAEEVQNAFAPAVDPDTEAAKPVIDLIEALPQEITLENKQAVQEARDAYDALTEPQQALVTNLDKLTAAEKILADLKAPATEEDKKLADVVIGMIADLPEAGQITLIQEKDVQDARTLYNELTDKQKALVPTESVEKLEALEQKLTELHAQADATAATAVEELIAALPDVVAKENKAEIRNARSEYNKLTETQQGLVKNVDKLVKAEADLEELEKADGKYTYYLSFEDLSGTNAFESKIVEVRSDSRKVIEIIDLYLPNPEGEDKSYQFFGKQTGNFYDEYPSAFYIDGKWVENEDPSNPGAPEKNPEGKLWVVTSNCKHSPYDVMTTEYTPNKSVIRLIYTPDGGKIIGVNDVTLNANNGKGVRPNKDQLIKDLLVRINDPMYEQAKAVWLDPAASQDDVDKAWEKGNPATGLALNKSGTQSLDKNATLNLKAIISTENPDAPCTSKLTWKSSNENIATVKDNGDGTATVTPVRSGTVTVTASASKFEASVKVYVKVDPYTQNPIIKPDESEGAAQSIGKATVTIEKFTLNEDGYIVAPVVLDIIPQKSYTPEMMLRAAFGEDTLRTALKSAAGFEKIVYALKDPSDKAGDDWGYLANGDYGKASRWVMTINNRIVEDPSQLTTSQLRGGEVIRFIYSKDGSADIGVKGNVLAVNKTDLMRLYASIDGTKLIPSSPLFFAYRTAGTVLRSLTADQATVDDAYTKLDYAFNNKDLVEAETLTLDKTELALPKGSTETVTVTVTPKATTDAVHWEIADPTVIGFTDKYEKLDENGQATRTLKALKDGTTTLTVTAGKQTAVCTITVKLIPAENIEITNTETTVMLRKNLTMTAKVTPEDTTEKLTWSVDHPEIARIDEKTGMVTPVSLGRVVVTAKIGDLTASHELVVIPYDGPYVYFEYDDGRPNQKMNADGIITVSTLDAGTFKVGRIPQDHEVVWDCTHLLTDEEGLHTSHPFIGADGRFNPHMGGSYSAKVTDIATDNVINFTLKLIPSGLKEIKAYVGDQELSEEVPYVAQGTEQVPYHVMGLTGEGKWVNVPLGAITPDGGGSAGLIKPNGYFQIAVDSNCTFTLILRENTKVRTTFRATSEHIPVEDFTLTIPEKFAIDSWNGIFFDDFNGIQPFSGFQIAFTPANASNKGLVWKALTPEIADYVAIHNAGIVPKKAGLAKFEVWSSDNPEIKKNVEVEFYYKLPLQSFECTTPEITMKEFETKGLGFNFNPGDATEKRMHWSFEGDQDIIQINTTIKNDIDNVATPKMTSFAIYAKKPGTVKVTATPYDETNGLKPVTFTVTVEKNNDIEEVDYVAEARGGILHGQNYLKNEGSSYAFGDEWTLFTLLRSGAAVDQTAQDAYYENIVSNIATVSRKRSTDLARVILTLGAMGKDPTNVGGVNLMQKIVNDPMLKLGDTSNAYAFTLISIDSLGYEPTAGDAFNREKLISKILEFQHPDGGFGLGDAESISIDMTGMCLQALAPYNTATYPEAKAAIAKAVAYLKSAIDPATGGFTFEGGMNGCTASQVVTALSALGIDAAQEEGFKNGPANPVANMMLFKDENGGFATFDGKSADLMGSQQITYGFEAYLRMREGRNRLYDLTDVNGGSTPEPQPEVTEQDKAAAKGVADLIEALPAAGKVAKSDKEAIQAARAAYNKLTDVQKKLVTNLNKLTAAEKALADLDKPEKPVNGHVYFSAERFVIGQGFIQEPMIVEIHEGDNYASIITRVLNGAASIRDRGNYLEYIKGADLGRDFVKVPEYIEKMSKGRFNTEAALKFYDSVGMEAWGEGNLGEFTYSRDSGWMYSVNGVQPSIGIGQKVPVDGDIVRLQYTVFGLGMDLIGSEEMPFTNMDAVIKAMAMANAEPVLKLDADVAKAYTACMNILPDPTAVTVEAVNEAAETLMSALKKAGKDIVKVVQDGINALPEADRVTLNDKAMIETVRNAYDSLTNEQKQQITNVKKLTAAEDALDLLENPPMPEFTDIEKHWGKEAIEFAVSHGLFKGITDTIFGPNVKMTRGMFVTVLGRMAGVDPNGSGKTQFPDVPEKEYFAPYIAWAVENGIAKGMPDGTFMPKENVTRQQMAAFLARYCEVMKIKLNDTSKVEFVDADSIQSWAVEYVNTVASAGLLIGDENHAFRPRALATRAEVATLLTRFIKNYAGE